jgi:hypothetical protein
MDVFENHMAVFVEEGRPAVVKNGRNRLPQVPPVESDPHSSQGESQKRRFQQSLKINHQIKKTVVFPVQSPDGGKFSEVSPTLYVNNNDLGYPAKIFKQGNSGRFNEPGDMRIGEAFPKQVKRRHRVNDIPERGQTDDGNPFQFR